MVRRLPRESTLSPLYHLFAASQQAGSLLAAAMVDAPLDAEDYARYSAIRETQPVSPTALARHLGTPITTVLDAVRAMTDRGHVVKVRNPGDGRSYLVRLTEEGERLHDETEVLFSQADLRLSAHLGERKAQVTEALAVLKAAAAAAIEDLRQDRTDLTG